MGRLTDDMTRLVGEICAARGDRGRLTQDLKHSAAAVKHAVASLRGAFAADLAGARAAWVGATAAVSRQAEEPEPTGSEGWRAVAGRQDVLREAAAERRRLEAERRARDEARAAPKARGRHRPR